MRSKAKEYPGIDLFRIVAAILVVAIHISPLASYSAQADMILTRIIARIAVPFFFMTTGFFLFGMKEQEQRQENRQLDHLKKFYKKTVLLYVWSIFLYLPINIYTGYFQENSGGQILRDILINGTFYHLWYLPAVLLGVTVTALFLHYLGMRRAWKYVVLLYVIGLFGDSYYGFIKNVPIMGLFYEMLFHICDYTRNGLFFAPMYLLLGAYVRQYIGCCRCSEGEGKNCRRKILAGLFGSFTGLFLEAYALHCAEFPRHDSMYVLLVPVMYFLFIFLMQMRGRRRAKCAGIAMTVYIIHPLVIIGLRGVARILHREALLVGNSLMQFVSVVFVSLALAVSWIYGKLWLRRKRIR